MLRALGRAFFSGSTGSSSDLLRSWRGLLLSGRSTVTREHEDAFKELVATAVRVRQGRPQGMLPDELTSTLREYFSSLDDHGREIFFHNLTTHFGVDHDEVDAAVAAWQQLPPRNAAAGDGNGGGGGGGMQRAAERLFNAAQPLYSRLWVPLSQQHDGITFLVRLRASLLRCIAHRPSGAAPLRAMSESLRRSLSEWFSVGLLRLERITWEDSSAAMLEKIMAEEKVHAIHSWEDLRRRLGPDRRVFVWTHPSLPGEPLVALHVALCQSLPSRMSDLIGANIPGTSSSSICNSDGFAAAAGSEVKDFDKQLADDAASDSSAPAATTAVFYSISNMQPGLAGVDLGNNLIKAAAKALAAELPELRTLCTLSPLPGFAAWLDAQMEARSMHGATAGPPPKLLLADEAAALASAAGEHRDLTAAEQVALLRGALRQGRWRGIPELAAALRPALLRLAARYLLREKHRGQALDPVANFHLRNGAQVQRLCFDADDSEAGRARSHGVMVSYGYSVQSVEENNRRYLVGGEIAAAPEVLRLLH